MKLEEIYELWSQDCKIDDTELTRESLKIPELHHKYRKIYDAEQWRLSQLEMDYKVLYKLKYEYLTGSLDLDTIREQGWEPSQKLIIKAEVGMHLEADKEIQDLTLKIGIQKQKIAALKSMLDMISNRSYHINNAIDWARFINGN